MKLLNLIFIIIAASLTACVSSWHQVNLKGLSSVQNQTFHVRSVTIDCDKITNILGRCSKSCQLSILNNIPMSDITRILSESYGINIAQENNLSIGWYQFGDPEEHILPATKILSAGRLKVSFHIEDLFTDHEVDSSNTCFSLQDDSYYTHYIDIHYTLDFKGLQPPLHRGATLLYDIEVAEVIQEQPSIIAPPSSSESILIGHLGEIETFRFDSNNKLDKMRDAAVKIPSVLERDIKAYQSSNKP